MLFQPWRDRLAFLGGDQRGVDLAALCIKVLRAGVRWQGQPEGGNEYDGELGAVHGRKYKGWRMNPAVPRPSWRIVNQ